MKNKIIITNSQYNTLLNIKENFNKDKKPSAQDQVKNKVNAGVMDNIVYSGGMMESLTDKFDYKYFINSLLYFLEKEGIKIKPFPKIILKWDEQNGLFIKTGFYSPSEKKIVLFCKDRHPKDILRSFTHECIHHMQNLEGQDMNFTNEDNVKDNKELEKLESEAYLKGNILFRKWTEYEKNKDNDNILNEAIISISQLRELTKELDEKCIIYAPKVDESIEANDVDLSSFNIKKNLNPKFWKDEKLDSRIRIKLLDIADDFIEFLGINWVKPDDIIITGSLANFNWDKQYSDIDLHILIDYKKVDKRIDFVKNYFYSQKKLWNNEHKNIKIFGFPVEVYVQDTNEKHVSNGIYSLEKNEWITEPKKENINNIKINKNIIKKEVSVYTKKIDNIIEKFDDTNNDKYKLEKLLKYSESLFNNIKKQRQKGLNNTNNEINEGNIIFKCLRRLGYIEKLSKLITRIYDKMNSLP